ncbi:MAG: response regulator transcription factor [Desulfobacterales bacterium]|jgi:DNA-binding NarL/FixJ family response regulator|nr:response regulator transcription factor [Desulfobacterales bacterium]
MANTKNIVLAEDHRLLREGVRALLHSRRDFQVVCEAENGIEAIRCVEKHAPDLILLDLSMPKMSGLSVIKEIKSRFPEVKILTLTIHESDQYVLEAFQSGADGYCLKDASKDELLIAIESVLNGKTYISPGISEGVMVGYLEGKKTLKTSTTWDNITQREKDVLKLIGEGYRNKEIADFLNISVKTVEKHRANIMKKTDLHNVSALTAYAIEKKLVTKSC